MECPILMEAELGTETGSCLDLLTCWNQIQHQVAYKQKFVAHGSGKWKSEIRVLE